MSFLPSLSPGNVHHRLPTGFNFNNDLRYRRPTEFLDLGINAAYGVTGVPEKIKGLVAVYPNDVAPANNYVALHLDTTDDSSYIVNWGDGTTETLTENQDHFHVYNYTGITGDTSTTKSTPFRGYRQAIFEVTLSGSAKFTQINLGALNGPFTQTVSNERTRGSSILDLFVSTSNATDVNISQSRPLTLCEQIEFRNTSSNRVAQPRLIFQGCRSLQSIPFVFWVYNAGTRDYLDCFKECRSLKFLPDEFASEDKFWFKSSSRFQSTFQNCHELRYIPEGIFSNNIHTSCSNFFRMFINCFKLKYIPYIGVRTGSGEDTSLHAMFTNCKALTKLPKGLSLQRATSSGFQSMIELCSSVKDFSSLFDGVTDMFANMNGSSFSFLSAFRGLNQLREFPFVGQFTKCSNVANMFLQSDNLVRFNSAYTHLDFSNATNMSQVFASCPNLQEVPEIKVRSVTANNGFASTFSNCFSLRSVKFTGMIAGPANGEYQRMFMSCFNLTCIDGVDFSFATETSDYFQMTNTMKNLNAIKFPGTHRKGATRIIVTVANHSDISGEYHITADGTGYAQASGNGVLTVAESGGNYTWTIKDSSDNTPTETSAAASTTQYTPWDADWSGATNAVTFTEVETGFKYTISGNSGDGLRHNPIPRTQMLEIFNQLVTISHSATIDIRNNSYTSDLTADDIAIATNKGWTVSVD